MKFFHISDLHIGLKLIKRDLLEDQKYILQQIVEIGKRERPDAIVIAGDIFDKSVPSAEAVSVFDEFIYKFREALPETVIMAISGNHDSAERTNLFRSILAERKFFMIGLPPVKEEDFIEKVSLRDEFGEVHFYLLPFVNPSMCKNIFPENDGKRLSYNDTLHRLIERERIDEKERNVFVSHQYYPPKGCDAETTERMDSEIRMVGNIDEVNGDFLEQFDYAALGHIHKPMQVRGEFHRYCGTPLACSVSEAGQEKAIIMVELGKKGDRKIEKLPLIPLRKVRKLKGTFEELKSLACEDYVSLIITDEEIADRVGISTELRDLFPNLLQYGFENLGQVDFTAVDERMKKDNDFTPMELCELFVDNLSTEAKSFLSEVINQVSEEGEK